MPVQKDSKLGQWIAAIREGWPSVRARFDDWRDAVREEPVLIWQTSAIRYSVYGLGALIAVSLLIWAVEAVQPVEVAPTAETADFHVLCTASGCGHHFVINEEFDFDDFPVVCPKCQNKNGYRALHCVSKTCRSRWVVPNKKNDELRCPHCGGYLGRVD